MKWKKLMSKIRVNKVYGHLKRSNKKIIVEQGGTRSGKTYNILLWIIFYYCSRNQGKTITIARKTFPAVRSSVMRDFLEILKSVAAILKGKGHGIAAHAVVLLVRDENG